MKGVILKTVLVLFILVNIISCTPKKHWESYNTINGLANNCVFNVAIDIKGDKWFCTQNGVSVYNGNNWTNYLPGIHVYGVTVDKNGEIWFGTSLGISKFDGKTWTHWMITGVIPFNEDIDKVTIIDKDNKYIKISQYTGDWILYKKNYLNAANGELINTVRRITIDPQKNKWFATSSGVYKFDGKNWTCYRLVDAVISVCIDHQGNKWFGTAGFGVAKFDNTNLKLFTTKNGLANNTVQDIAVDYNGNMWFATNNGVSEFDGLNWSTYLQNNYIHTIAIDSQNIFWFGADHGLARYDGKAWTSYTTENGLIYNVINKISVDSQNNKWFATNQGVSVYFEN